MTRALPNWTLPLLLVATMLLVSGRAAAQPSGPMPAGIVFAPPFGEKVPLDVALVDEDGHDRSLADYVDGRKPVVLVMAYYECPMLCSLVLNGLVSALRATGLSPGDDFEVVVASIDPSDTPARAAAKKASYVHYYDRPGAERALHFLTGREGEVKRLADAVGFKYEYDPIGKQFAHPAGVTILTADGTISRALFGVDFAPRDLRLALVEAAKGTIGTAKDRLLLLCFHYDPERGKYGGLAMGAVRAGGVLTLAVLGISILVMRRRNG